MSIVVPNTGEIELSGRMLNDIASADILHLYINNVSISEETTLIDITESTGTGYASIPLTGGWTCGVDGNSFPEQTFIYTGPESNVYGYYITNNDSSILLWIESFSDGPYEIPSDGGSIKITPFIKLN